MEFSRRSPKFKLGYVVAPQILTLSSCYADNLREKFLQTRANRAKDWQILRGCSIKVRTFHCYTAPISLHTSCNLILHDYFFAIIFP